jgi:hypothetical protein
MKYWESRELQRGRSDSNRNQPSMMQMLQWVLHCVEDAVQAVTIKMVRVPLLAALFLDVAASANVLVITKRVAQMIKMV